MDMLHGIKGLLDKQYVDLSEKIKTDIDIDLLKRTPSSYLGHVVISSQKYLMTEILTRRFLKYLKNSTFHTSST